MKPFLSGNLYRLTTVSGFLTLTLFLIFSSCSKPKDTSEKDRFPLIANASELDVASKKAGTKMLVLDLSADWCMPCKMLEPTLHELSTEFKGKAVFYRVDVDKSSELASSFGVRGIPYVLFFKKGKVVYTLTGLNPKENYAKVLGVCNDTLTADQCADQIKEKMEN
jgi:thioredoxin 1